VAGPPARIGRWSGGRRHRLRGHPHPAGPSAVACRWTVGQPASARPRWRPALRPGCRLAAT